MVDRNLKTIILVIKATDMRITSEFAWYLIVLKTIMDGEFAWYFEMSDVMFAVTFSDVKELTDD